MRADRQFPAPWYKEAWPWILMAGPAAVIVAGFFTLAIALMSDDGLVADDYYKRGLAVNQVLRRDERARELHLTATANFSDARVRVALQGISDAPQELRLRVIHPTRAGHDQTVILRASAPAVYDAALAPVDAETRRLVLEDLDSKWRLTGTWLKRQPAAVLSALP
jgi:hypothetical protein